MPNKVPFISLRNAAFRLGDSLVFERTHWTFHTDEHWAILGKNGSGKTLFAEALRGKIPIVRGELVCHFRPPKGLSHEECLIQVSFEDRRIDARDFAAQSRWNSFEEESSLSVHDFLSFERVMSINPYEVNPHLERRRIRFEALRRRAIMLLQIQPLLDRHLLSLSNGELQKLHLARALCHPMKLLILDEPFAGLDASSRDHLRKILEGLMQTRLRVLILTSGDEELPRLITHAMRLENCHVAACHAVAKGASASLRGSSQRHRKPASVQPRRTPPGRVSAISKPAELVVMRNVTIRYGARIILDRVNWRIVAGESWGLLGPNGSGKTTLLSLILGDHPQVYANEIAVLGRHRGSGESVWEIKRHIGWVSPELQTSFDSSMTCLEVVASGFQNSTGLFERPTRNQRKLARGWLRLFGFSEQHDWPMEALSAGQARCLLLARALVKSPKLLILDEPCQGLDNAHRDLFLACLDRWIRAKVTTVIYVTHRPEEIPPSIKRIFKLEKR